MEAGSETLATIPDWQHINIATLEHFIDSQAGVDYVLELQGRDAVAVVDLLDQVALPPNYLSPTLTTPS